jgi:hypothetical protein
VTRAHTAGDECFDNFEQTVSDAVEQCWENIVDVIVRPVARTAARFQECFDQLVSPRPLFSRTKVIVETTHGGLPELVRSHENS